MDITDTLRDMIAGIDGLSEEQRKLLSDEMDSIDSKHDRVADDRDSEAARADAAPDEDEINDDIRRDLARELEPIFAAIHLGDLDRARGGGQRASWPATRRRPDHRRDPEREVAAVPAPCAGGLT